MAEIARNLGAWGLSDGKGNQGYGGKGEKMIILDNVPLSPLYLRAPLSRLFGLEFVSILFESFFSDLSLFLREK